MKVSNLLNEQSGPSNPGLHWQCPKTHSPFPEQPLGHAEVRSLDTVAVISMV